MKIQLDVLYLEGADFSLLPSSSDLDWLVSVCLYLWLKFWPVTTF